MPDYTPVHNPGHEVTLVASAAVTGGQCLVVSGNGTVAPGTAASAAFVGVAAFDAASGTRLTVFVHHFVHETTASGAITAGDQLVNGPGGAVSTIGAGTAFQSIGTALTTAANGALVRWIAK